MPRSSQSLEDRLRILANAGELTHLSVTTRAGKGRGGTVFSASYAPASLFGHSIADDPDPVNAIMRVLNDPKFASLKIGRDTAELPVVQPTPPTKAEQDRFAGGRAPLPDEPPEDESWLRAE
jgi:hypothetical protein